MHMGIGDAGGDGAPVQVDDLRLGQLACEDFLIGTDGVNARAGDGESLRPWSFGIASVDMAVDENGVAGECSGKGYGDCCTKDHSGSACKHLCLRRMKKGTSTAPECNTPRESSCDQARLFTIHSRIRRTTDSGASTSSSTVPPVYLREKILARASSM